MGRLLESATGRAFSIGEIPWHETRRGGVPHGGRLSGRSRALTTRYHVHGTAVGRARGARVALDRPCSPDHRGRPIGADPARRRERRLGRRDHTCAGARAAAARRAGTRPAPLSARRQQVRRGGARGRPCPRRDRRYRRGGVSPHRRSGRAVRLARRLVRHTREGARAVASRGSDAGAPQAATLHLADERRAYALADLPTYARIAGLESRILFAADTALTNPYTLYLVRRPAPHPDARAFATWATHAGREAVLALRLPDGTPAFVPRAGDCEATAKS